MNESGEKSPGETSLRLDERLVARGDIIADGKITSDPKKNKVTLNWPGGEISWTCAQELFSDGEVSTGKFHNFLATSVVVYGFKNFDALGAKITRNPKESLSAVLTLIATTNEAAIIKNLPLNHLVRANPASRNYFERLRQLGWYSYADIKGEATNRPTVLDTDNGKYTLYSSVLPKPVIHEQLGEFANTQAAEKIAQTYTPPRPKSSLPELLLKLLRTL